MLRSKLNQSVLAIVAFGVCVLGSSASAVVVDGVFNPNEGYTNVQPLTFKLQNGSTVQDPGTLAWTTDANGNVFVAFVQPLSINDNTYGTNAIGWSNGHKFGDLTGSDKAQFNFMNNAGQTFIYTLDYISASTASTSGFGSLGVTGGDGSVGKDNFNSVAKGTTIFGKASDVLAWGTSLDYNLNQIAGHGTSSAPGLGFGSFTTNSPATSPNALNPDGTIDYSKGYKNPSSAPGWVYYITYEIEISASAFGPTGFAGVLVPAAHDSPSKVGQNTIPVIPEPGNYFAGLFALGLIGLSHFKIFRRGVARA